MACTVVSLYPREISNEFKPGLQPGLFDIPASDGKTPVVLHIDDNFTRRVYVPLEEDPARAWLSLPESAKVVAASIVNDFASSMSLIDEGCRPGLFWVEGTWKAEEIQEQFPEQYELAYQRQLNWFEALVKDADDSWQKFRQHRLINDLHRMAAAQLKLKREWGALRKAGSELMDCKFCTAQIPDFAVICPNCKQVLDSERMAEMQA